MTTRPTLIGLVGPAGSGKDTAATRLVADHGYVAYALAEPIRTMLYALFGEANIPAGQLFSPDYKADPIEQLHGATPRHLMQSLGTEWGRKLVHEDVWLTVAERHLGLQQGDEPVSERIVITDVRFENEAAWVRKHGGYLVSIHHPGAGLHGSTGQHSSETGVASIDTHFALGNDGSIAALWDHVDDLAQQVESLRGGYPIPTGWTYLPWSGEPDMTRHQQQGSHARLIDDIASVVFQRAKGE